jgi:hypothetical protein
VHAVVATVVVLVAAFVVVAAAVVAAAVVAAAVAAAAAVVEVVIVESSVDVFSLLVAVKTEKCSKPTGIQNDVLHHTAKNYELSKIFDQSPEIFSHRSIVYAIQLQWAAMLFN